MANRKPARDAGAGVCRPSLAAAHAGVDEGFAGGRARGVQGTEAGRLSDQPQRGAVDTEALMDRARDVSRAFRSKLGPELEREFDAVMRAHAAVVAALFAGEVAQLRRDVR